MARVSCAWRQTQLETTHALCGPRPSSRLTPSEYVKIAMQLLKLVALDRDDLNVISAQLQDAVMRVADIAFLSRERRLALVMNRFDWPAAAASEGQRRPNNERRRSALRFEHVQSVKRQNITQTAPDAVLSLLAINFEESQAPSGFVTLVFAGGGALRLAVDCIEAELRDLGGVWAASGRPDHGETPPGATRR